MRAPLKTALASWAPSINIIIIIIIIIITIIIIIILFLPSWERKFGDNIVSMAIIKIIAWNETSMRSKLWRQRKYCCVKENPPTCLGKTGNCDMNI